MERNTRHHLLYPAAEWMLRPEGVAIRTTPSLIAPLPRPEHDFVHEAVSIIPALGHNTLRAVLRLWTPERDTFKDLDALCRAIGQAASNERSSRIETNLAHVTVEALELEKKALRQIGYRGR